MANLSMISLFKNSRILFILLFLIFFLSFSEMSFAEDATPTPTPGASDAQKTQELQKQIADLQSKISDLKSQQKSLNSQISIIDSQTELSVLKIEEAQEEIKALQGDIEITKEKIVNTEGDLEKTSHAFIGRAEAVYKQGGIDPWQVILTSNSLDNFFTRLKYLKIVQLFDKKQIYAAEQAKVSYQQQQDILEDKKKEEEALNKKLQDYTDQLNRDKESKKTLLAQTQGSEANYQKLLSQAQAQLAGFSKFVTSQGGASILPAQASPDGFYYNQRDERWGNNSIGVSGEPVWKYGCLLSSIAMVLKQQGENVTPADVANNTSYFFADTAYVRIPWAGGRFTSIWQRDIGAIDSKLASGKLVIVGLTAGAYGTHFIVLKSGSNGSYVMNDPWYGANLDFTSHYNKDQIFQYGYLN